METLADYGTVSYFGLGVFTTGIFRTWFGLGDGAAAAKLAAILLMFVFVLVIIERWSRKRAQYHHTSNRYSSLPQYQLHGYRSCSRFVPVSFHCCLGFLLPAGQLVIWGFETYEYMLDESFVRLTMHSVMLALSAAMLAVVLALFLAYGKRLYRSNMVTASIRVVATGYAIPGTVVAVGVIIPFAWIDNSLDS